MDFLYAILGLLILLLAGDTLVRGAVNLSLRLGVPAMIVSLTIVAFGTSAPELLVAVQSVREHAPGIALGNVVGSNIVNILLVLGVPALLSGINTGTCDIRRNYIAMMAATAMFMFLAATSHRFAAPQGAILLVGLALMVGSAFNEAMAHRRDHKARCLAEAEDAALCEDDPLEDVEGADPQMPWYKVILFIVLGLIGLPIGADVLVSAASAIARDHGVSETVIGLTLVAVGTSLPELATTVMAAVRGQAEVVLGNVIGSNMFNLLAIIGVAALVGPIPVEPMMLRFDLVIMFFTALLIAPFVFKGWHMGKRWGIVFVGLYGAYMTSLLG
ncbi:MAG: sodium:calcium antiporter [Alphaproteobacteria bacterium]|nr:MAG: sodium:calcium antiporter [Alphaproteobacteria bacterium]